MASGNGFWGRKDSMWGGETLNCADGSRRLCVKRGDKFRVEKGPGRRLTLIPDPDNKGTWKDSHDKSNPIRINPTKHTPTNFKRAYSMRVTIEKGARPERLFLVELDDGSIGISLTAFDPSSGHDDDMASVER